jgi:hypothetical protein
MKTARERIAILGPVLRETEWYISSRARHGAPKFISRRGRAHSAVPIML